MSDDSRLMLFVFFSAICFAVGFIVSWIRAKRRLQAQIDERLRKEVESRIAEELLKRLASGPLADEIQNAVRDAQKAERAGNAAGASTADKEGAAPESGAAGGSGQSGDGPNRQ